MPTSENPSPEKPIRPSAPQDIIGRVDIDLDSEGEFDEVVVPAYLAPNGPGNTATAEFWTHPYVVTAEDIQKVPDPTVLQTICYLDFLAKNHYAFGPSLGLEVYASRLLGLKRPIERLNWHDGTTTYIRLNSPAAIGARQHMLDQWEGTVMSNNLLLTSPDRRRSGPESMDKIEAGIIKVVMNALQTPGSAPRDFYDMAEGIYRTIVDKKALLAVIEKHFQHSLTYSEESMKYRKESLRKHLKNVMGNRARAFWGWLGIDIDEDIGASQVDTSELDEIHEPGVWDKNDRF